MNFTSGDIIPICIETNLSVGGNCSVFFEGNLMNCEVLNRLHSYNAPDYGDYLVKILEYPAKKVIK